LACRRCHQLRSSGDIATGGISHHPIEAGNFFVSDLVTFLLSAVGCRLSAGGWRLALNPVCLLIASVPSILNQQIKSISFISSLLLLYFRYCFFLHRSTKDLHPSAL
jgi:hypothetical protein